MLLWRLSALSVLAAAGLYSGHAIANANQQTSYFEEVPLVAEEQVLWTAQATSDDFMDIAVDELLRISRTEEVDLRVAAVEVLGEIKTERAVATLGVILYENPYVQVRQTAAFVLGQIGTDNALEAIAVAMEYESDPQVRDAQMQAIGMALPDETVELPVGIAAASFGESELALVTE